MADSDDEYDRKRRDKFRGERSSGESYRSERRDERRGAGGVGGRDDWTERNPFRGGAGGRPRPEYREYRPRDRYGSPGREMPPGKRMRADWVDELRGNPRYGGYDPYLMHAYEQYAHSMHAGAYAHAHPPHREAPVVNSDTQTQPAMMSLKQFLDTQDDGISDSEVLRKYTEYKLEFKRQQLNEFFVAHKDEEWFKNKYHPVESVNRKEEQLGFLKQRVSVFTELFENEQIKTVSIDTTQTEQLLRLLDTVVIKLEGGTEEDLKILDEKPRDITFPDRIYERRRPAEQTQNQPEDDDVIITAVETKEPENVVEPEVVSPRPVRRVTVGSDEENWDDDDATPASAAPPVLKKSIEKAESRKKRKEKIQKRKRSISESTTTSTSSSDSSSSSSSDDDDEDDDKANDKYDLSKVKVEPLPAVKVKEEPEDKTATAEKDVLAEKEVEKSPADERNTKTPDVSYEKETELSLDDTPNSINTDDNTNDDKENKSTENVEKLSTEQLDDGKTEVGVNDDDVNMENEDKSNDAELDKTSEVEKSGGTNAETSVILLEEPTEQVPTETIDLDKEKDLPVPRALHRTSSIFLRNLAPSITKSEIEKVCQRYDGYLRVAIADPLVERRWYRRGWVTFKRDVNIKEICWNLNNTRLRDCEMGAIVNRDLSRRVRPVNGMTAHKTVVRADIKLCAKIALNLDEKFQLWDQQNLKSNEKTGNSNGNSMSSYGFHSNNPVLQNITDFLIEEASAEEDELLGISGSQKDTDGETIDRDLQLIAVLDNLILYLRIVHSVDFYNHCEYPYEDEMPNRCGIIHARGPAPAKITQNDLQDYIKTFETKMQPFLAKTTKIDDEELKNLGRKDAEAEVEKFIQANTQELAKDKWLCPLSGKKFKGPEFIRKHIFNKHVEKVDEVRKEVEFFNNYLRDPKRPQLPEHPGSSKRNNSESSGGGGGFRPPMYPPAYAAYAYAPPMMMPGRGRGFGGGMGGRRGGMPFEHQRRIIGYHDLDAPANFDKFD